ncbi:hypothetical protein B0T12DRAFT_411657 [Alternaria alternata]|jgi:hypothetical protein|nr:hypothetical protein B0T12DRAFT_411657 [Alternaria alternata]
MVISSHRAILLHSLCFIICLSIVVAETYTNAACNAVEATMGSCAQRWDSIRTECTNSVTTNTIWPGPCECSYYGNDLPCFDEQAACANQVWTQLPQWFRDGVTSCLMKDESYTIRAQLGSVENPFSTTGIAGNVTRATAAQTGRMISSPTVSSTTGSFNVPSATTNSHSTIYTPLSTSATVSGIQRASSSGFSAGSKAGIGVGITIGILTTIALAVWLVKRKRRSLSDEATETESGTAELHNNDVKIYETEVETYSKHELAAGSRPELGGNPRSELDGGATREIPGIHALHEVDGQVMDGPGGRFTERQD